MTIAQDTFWLAHYAYNTINPIVEQVKAIEPSTQLGIEVVFGHDEAAHSREPKVGIAVHWSREGMFHFAPSLHNQTEVDLAIQRAQDKLDKLKAKEDVDRRMPELQPLNQP